MVDLSFGRGGNRRPGRTFLVLLLSFLGAGCYSYTPVAPAAAAPGSSVRVRLVPNSALPADPALAPAGARLLHGRILPAKSPDTLLLSVALRSEDPRMPVLGLRSALQVPVAELERLEVRRLQKGRTAATIAAAALVGVVVLDWAFDVTLPGEGRGEPGDVNNLRRESWRSRW